jgi:N-acetylglucosamine-6-phosphate deacetylase
MHPFWQERRHCAAQGALAATGFPDQAYDLARRDIQVSAADYVAGTGSAAGDDVHTA